MTRDEKHIARLLFKQKIYESDKQSYEDLFVKVMESSNSNFEPVKAQGQYGDRKNDGFDKIKGVYYQVYAPEDLPSKEGVAINKLNTDFQGLKKYWEGKGFKINEFYYAVNDKYKGNYPTLIADIAALGKQNNITTDIFRNRSLEVLFLSLSDPEILNIINFIPDPLEIQEPDYSIMGEVVKFIMNFDVPDVVEIIPDDPNFENKLMFNNLSSYVCEYLNAGRRQSYVINEYFGLNSDFVKEELRKRFNSIYNQGKKKIPESDTKNDELFMYILKKSSPSNKMSIYNAVYILMAYYFEYCDIYETPIQS